MPFRPLLGIVVVAAITSACGGSSGEATRHISGSISGLTGTGLRLYALGEIISVAPNASTFAFATPLPLGTFYDLSVAADPTGQTCTLKGGTGTLTTAATNIQVQCANLYSVGGTIAGLAGSGLVLINDRDMVYVPAGASSFQLSRQVAAGQPYAVTVHAQPAGQVCTVADGAGTVVAANIGSVRVSCSN
jgi:hypothetical protein